MFEPGQKVVCVNANRKRPAIALTHGAVYTVAWAGHVEIAPNIIVVYPDGETVRGGRHYLVELVEVKNVYNDGKAFSASRFRPLRSIDQGIEMLRKIVEETPIKADA